MACACDECKYVAEFQAHLNAIPAEHRPFFEGLMIRYEALSLDNEVNQAILDGSWPSALDYIKHTADKLGMTLISK
jgi:hypothetical protein